MQIFLRRHRSLLFAIALQVIGAVLMAGLVVLFVYGPLVQVAAYGLMIGTLVLLAAWMSLTTPPAPVRVTAALASGLALAFYATLAMVALSYDVNWTLVWISAVSLVWLAIPFQAARRLLHWRLVIPGQPATQVGSSRQFSMLLMMLCTSGIACFLALGRPFVSMVMYVPTAQELRQILPLSLALAVVGLPGVLTVGAVVDKERRLLWAAIAASLTILGGYLAGGGAFLNGFWFTGSLRVIVIALQAELLLCGNVLLSLFIWQRTQNSPVYIVAEAVAPSAKSADMAEAPLAEEQST